MKFRASTPYPFLYLVIKADVRQVSGDHGEAVKKLIIIAVICAAGWHLKDGNIPFLSSAGAYDNSGNPVVWLFTVDGCGKPCDSSRDQLNRRRVDFEEKRIDVNDDSDEDVKFWERNGRNLFPLIAAGNEIAIGPSSSKLATVLALTFGEEYLTRNEEILFKDHFYADGSPKIVMYGADWCPYCKKLRTEFTNDNIDFVEIDVDRHAKKDLILRTMQIEGYPATWVGYTRVAGSTLKAVNKVASNY